MYRLKVMIDIALTPTVRIQKHTSSRVDDQPNEQSQQISHEDEWTITHMAQQALALRVAARQMAGGSAVC